MAKMEFQDEGPAERAVLIVPPGEPDAGDWFAAEDLDEDADTVEWAVEEAAGLDGRGETA